MNSDSLADKSIAMDLKCSQVDDVIEGLPIYDSFLDDQFWHSLQFDYVSNLNATPAKIHALVANGQQHRQHHSSSNLSLCIAHLQSYLPAMTFRLVNFPLMCRD